LIGWLNGQQNKSHYNLLFHNCADFVRTVFNFYYPHSIHRSFLAHAGLTTPKQVAKSLVSYSRRHSGIRSSSYVIPELPCGPHRSQPVDGFWEGVLKKYLVPTAILQPAITQVEAAAEGHNRRRGAPVSDVARIVHPQPSGHPTLAFIDACGSKSGWSERASRKSAIDLEPTPSPDCLTPQEVFGAFFAAGDGDQWASILA
jgi:hypothetical protein